MTVSDGHFIDRFTVKGNQGTVVGSTRIRKPRDPCGSLNCFYGFSPAWIQGDVVVGNVSWCLLGAPCSGNIGLWHYPRGGRPFKTISPYLTYVPFWPNRQPRTEVASHPILHSGVSDVIAS